MTAKISEAQVLREVRAVLASDPNVYIRRNSTGLLYTKYGRPVPAGFGKGSADLVGTYLVYPSTEYRYGLAIPFAVEVKSPTGKTSKEQDDWAETMTCLGWICETVRSAAEAEELLTILRGIAKRLQGAR